MTINMEFDEKLTKNIDWESENALCGNEDDNTKDRTNHQYIKKLLFALETLTESLNKTASGISDLLKNS